MNKLLIVLGLFIGLFIVSFPAVAQTSEDENENFSLSSGTSDSRDRVVMEVYWATLLNAPTELNVQSKSRGFNFYFFYDLALGGDNVSLAPGIGLDMPNIFHQSFLEVNTDSASPELGNTMITAFENNLSFKKNKLALTHLDVPVELRFRTGMNDKGNRFKLAIGFKAGLVIASHSKYIGEEYREGRIIEGNSDFIKVKEYRLRNVNSYRYGITGRLGYGNVNIQTYYGLSDVFEDGLGPAGNIFTVGISINSF